MRQVYFYYTKTSCYDVLTIRNIPNKTLWLDAQQNSPQINHNRSYRWLGANYMAPRYHYPRMNNEGLMQGYAALAKQRLLPAFWPKFPRHNIRYDSMMRGIPPRSLHHVYWSYLWASTSGVNYNGSTWIHNTIIACYKMSIWDVFQERASFGQRWLTTSPMKQTPRWSTHRGLHKILSEQF